MSKLPPGPHNRFLCTYRMMAQPYQYFPRWAAEYGDVFTVPVLNGDLVMIGSPEAARAVFAASPDTFSPFAFEVGAALIGENAIFNLSGERHRRERTLLMPAFHGERMRAYARIMADAAERHMAAAGSSRRVTFMHVAQRMLLEIMTRAVFGMQDAERTDMCMDRLSAMAEAMSPALAFIPFLLHEFGGIGPYARLRRRIEAIDAMLEEQMARAHEQPGEDILSLLSSARYEDGTAMGKQELCEELRTLLFAGHESTAITLTWAMELLHRHPEALARVRAELDELGTAPDPVRYTELPYLDAACKEILRLSPVTTEVFRQTVAPLEVPFGQGTVELPAGTSVAPSVVLIHRRPELYPEPEKFRPERFLERKFSPFEYLPFGGGHRRCVGAAFASFELKIVLGVALTRWQFHLLDDEAPRPVRRNITMAPSSGVPMYITSRRPKATRAAS